MVRRSLETERKYDVPEGAEVPAFPGFATSTAETESLRARYLDTAEGDLRRHAITLRTRSGGHDDGWHLKTPAAGGRNELSAPLEDELPSALGDEIRAIVRDRELVDIATLATERTRLHFLGDDGTPFAELADDRVTGSDVRAGTVTVWREWELELLDAAPVEPVAREDLLDRIETMLAGAGAVPSASSSKLGRALGSPRLVPEGPTLPAAAPVALGPVLAILSGLRSSLLSADAAVRRGDEDAVHRMRVLIRRLRAALVLAEGTLDPAIAADVRRRLREVGRALEPAREADLRRDRGAARLDASPDVDTAPARRVLVTVAEEEHRDAWQESLRAIDGTDWFRLLDDVDALIARPPLGPQALEPARPMLKRALRTSARRAARRLETARRSGDVDQLHRARRAVRRVRYLAEAVGPDGADVLGSRWTSLGSAARTVQDVLGEHRDALASAERLTSLAGSRGSATDVAGLERLARQEAEAAESAIGRLTSAAKGFRRARREIR